MREKRSKDGISARAVSGTHVVILGMNATEQSRRGLLGFAIRRTDHTEGEEYWLKGFKTFESVEPNPIPAQGYLLRDHPVQSFLWGDYTAKPDHDYTYDVVALRGLPSRLEEGPHVSVRIQTESEDADAHAIFFNRGVAASQAYVRRFQNRRPEAVPEREAFRWLSRGLEEAILAFIGQADGPRFGLRAAVYEFNYQPVLEAFKDAARAGADVRIIYDARADHPKGATEEAARRFGIRSLLIPRTTHTSYISHNKFVVLLEDARPTQVWTGSTNFTQGGIFGQANVGHLVRDAQVAQKYFDYWTLLFGDPKNRELRPKVEQLTRDPVGPAPDETTTVIFSPRRSLRALEWYAERLEAASETFCVTAAFGVHPLLAVVLGHDEDFIRYLLLERHGTNRDEYTRDRDLQVAVGSRLGMDTLYRWTREQLTGFNFHVRFAHTKFMLIDPLSDGPTTISGSANFSTASTKNNDENTLVIQGDKRVADIYLGEFMRLFNHFYFRYHVQRLEDLSEEAVKRRAFLAEDDTWTNRYYAADSIKTKQRLLFAG